MDFVSMSSEGGVVQGFNFLIPARDVRACYFQQGGAGPTVLGTQAGSDSRAGSSRTPRSSILNGRNAWLEGARLTQRRKKEEKWVHIGNPGSAYRVDSEAHN